MSLQCSSSRKLFVNMSSVTAHEAACLKFFDVCDWFDKGFVRDTPTFLKKEKIYIEDIFRDCAGHGVDISLLIRRFVNASLGKSHIKELQCRIKLLNLNYPMLKKVSNSYKRLLVMKYYNQGKILMFNLYISQ